MGRQIPSKRVINIKNIDPADFARISAAKNLDSQSFDQWGLDAALTKARSDHPELFPES